MNRPIDAAIAAACGRIAPLWPLKHFVAVNPFLGLADRHFMDAVRLMKHVGDIDVLPPHAFWRAAMAEGRIDDDDLAAVLEAHPDLSLDRVKEIVGSDPERLRPQGRIATVAELLDARAGGNRLAARTAFMIDEIAKFAASWFDEGQAAWRLPRGASLYAAWRDAARFDRNPQAMGIAGFGATVAASPDIAAEAIAATLDELGVPARAHADYLHRALLDIAGWAGIARWYGWQAELRGARDGTLIDLLAIRVVWGLALFREQTGSGFRAAWAEAMANATTARPAAANPDEGMIVGMVMQKAYEHRIQRALAERLARPVVAAPSVRPAVQAAFCIDVRSEVFRRALEAQSPAIETIGFAGFFGFAIEYVPIGRNEGGAQCPVLLAPAVTVREGVARAPEEEMRAVLARRLLRRRAAKAWKGFKVAAVSSFAFVETIGLAFAARIVGSALGRARPAPDPRTDGLDAAVAARLTPVLDPASVGGRATGFPPELRLQSAETVLRAMSLTENFARVVLLAGHGSSTVNNPHASSLDCGACGGHTGEANARVAAAILNDPAVRAGLRRRGLAVPDDTVFIAGLHDTTTDMVALYADDVPAEHADDLRQLRDWLAAAGQRARRERAPHLALEGRAVDDAIARRARDWAQVRPEWGLAGNAVFIAAPRTRTYGIDLGGRAFLHSYDWRADTEFKVLTLILTAPMVVASWINLQYYASSANNAVFGAGNKVLHNVVGALGVIEGNGGDLRVGLPWQSVHDGTRFVHEPVRLTAAIEAPKSAIEAVIAANPQVAALVANEWLFLWAIEKGGITRVMPYREAEDSRAN